MVPSLACARCDGHHRGAGPFGIDARPTFEQALGITFQGEQGDHFLRSSLITLFYGAFSGSVLWSREHPPTDEAPEFDWKEAAWYLKEPAIEVLFGQIARPGSMRNLAVGAIRDRAADVLNRVDRAGFFRQFQAGEVVQYFYEPFHEAFGLELTRRVNSTGTSLIRPLPFQDAP